MCDPQVFRIGNHLSLEYAIVIETYYTSQSWKGTGEICGIKIINCILCWSEICHGLKRIDCILPVYIEFVVQMFKLGTRKVEPNQGIQIDHCHAIRRKIISQETKITDARFLTRSDA